MERIKVWDVAVRGFHWALALLIALAFLTAGEDEWVALHARLGLGVLGLVVFRVLWGVWGPPQARFATFVRPPREVLAYARAMLRGRPPHHLGHNPLGGVMVVALLVTLAGLVLSGAVAYLGPEWDGPLSPWLGRPAAEALLELHEALSGVLPVLVAAHVAGVLVSSVLERQNLVAGMVTGFKRAGPPCEPVAAAPRRGALWAALLLGVAVALALAVLLPAGEAHAAGPQRSLLEAYASEARAQRPGFSGFDAAQGRALYLREHPRDGKVTSCATCHTEDPRRPGRSPAGRVIEPLAPAASPERFTDRRQADKWFERNCRQVVGRGCTVEEKGHLLSWLLSL